VESIFDGGCVVGVHLPPRAVVLDFEIESRRVHLECAVPGIQSPPHLLILCSHRFEPPLAPFPVPHFLLEMGNELKLTVLGSIGFIATYFFIRKIYGSIKID
jgi:hypothetical protein